MYRPISNKSTLLAFETDDRRMLNSTMTAQRSNLWCVNNIYAQNYAVANLVKRITCVCDMEK